jgi:hypothetical protein
MPVNIIDVSTFTDPVTAPAGGDVRNAASVVDPVQKLANRTRWLKNRIDGIAPQTGPNEGEIVYPTPIAGRTRVWGHGSFLPDAPANWDRTIAGAGGGLAYAPTADAAAGHFCIDGLPAGCTVTRVDVLIGTSSTRTGTNRWRALLYVAALGFSVPTATLTQIGTTLDDGGGATGLDVISFTGLTQSIDTSQDLVVAIIGPTGSIPSVDDKLYGVRVTFTDPGPRNF